MVSKRSMRGSQSDTVRGILFIYFALCGYIKANLFEGCDYEYFLNTTHSYVESPNYPSSYPPGSACRLKFVAPLDHVIKANCSIHMNMTSEQCCSEFFYVSRNGESSLMNFEEFWGSRTFTRESSFRSLIFAYISNGSNGYFRCHLHAVPQPCDCGWFDNSKIANGQEIGTNEFPSMVALRDSSSTEPIYCAGSIISHRHILTSAYCIHIQPIAAYIEARVGRTNLNYITESEYSAFYYIERIMEHPLYSIESLQNDIAILVTTADIEWSKGVGPICLPSWKSNKYYTYEVVDVIGWGSVSLGGNYSETLQKANVVVIDYKTCFDAYTHKVRVYRNQLCTFDFKRKGVCHVDLGGPIIFTFKRQFLLGILSFGEDCGQDGNFIGVNTRVTSFLLWISNNTRSSTCSVEY